MAELVVLPEPWSPAISTTVGGLGVGDLHGLAAEGAGQLVVDALTTCWAGFERTPIESAPTASLADAVADRADDGEVDVGLEQGGADLPQDLVDVGLATGGLCP